MPTVVGTCIVVVNGSVVITVVSTGVVVSGIVVVAGTVVGTCIVVVTGTEVVIGLLVGGFEVSEAAEVTVLVVGI